MKKYHYVYALIDPRDLTTFYVGKGTGDRKVQHFQSIPAWMKGEETTAKFKRINEIKADGMTPKAVVCSHHDTDEEALEAERRMIERIGIDNLTNQNIGGGGDKSTQAKKSKKTDQGLTSKQELFCKSVIEGKTFADAYREHYSVENMKPESIHREACELAKNPKVSSRIEELRRPIIESAQVTLEEVINGFRSAVDLAGETGNANALTGAYRELGKIADLYPAERKEVKNQHSFDDLTDDEIEQRLADVRKKLKD